MKIRSFSREAVLLTVLFGAMLCCAATLFAQDNSIGADQQQSRGQQAISTSQQPAKIPTADPQEDGTYKAFHAVSARDTKKKIQLGKQFLEKYPKSSYTGVVYDQMVKAYYLNQDWDDFFAAADKAIAINPDDLDVLPLVGWVIPRNYKEGDPDGKKKLDRAEMYDKTAIRLLATASKPAALTEDQFAQLKSSGLSQAHSGLGLIYFREQRPEDAAKELEQTTAADATDWFVLGASYEMLDKHNNAADAFKKCSVFPGALQATCQKNAEDATKEASVQ
jgi:tetratricopeptide (TPR) repeat protein